MADERAGAAVLRDDEWNAICRAAGEGHSEDECDALKVAVERILAARAIPGDDRVSSSGRPSNDRDGACTCDYNPETTDGPEEDCPFHGRPYAYWVERGDTLAARLAAVPGDDTARALDEVERRVRVMFLGEQPSESEDWQGKFGGLVNRPAVVMRVERIIREVRAAHAAAEPEAGR